MINFQSRLESKLLEKKINPIELYHSLDRASDKGPLRPAQIAILERWFKDFKEKKDVILKLHTGQGKTLVGLLILQSRINDNKGAAIYLCPNKHLVEQTCEQAKQFGIKHCKIDERNVIPQEFWDGKMILITHVQKLFNGLTIFGLRNRAVRVDSIVLDDSHACIDTIRDSFTIQIPRGEQAYNELLTLFEKDLEEQGVAKLAEIKNEEFGSLLPVPYWAWQDKHTEVASILVRHKELKSIKFAWEIVKDIITDCQCYFSGNSIEISPYTNPIEQFGTFANANHRVLMSATTNNDSFFIKGLGLSVDTVRNPLVYENESWSGEKMILIPYSIDDRLDKVEIVNQFAKPNPNRKFGVVALTPSNSGAEHWVICGAEIADGKTIDQKLKTLREGNYEKTIVISNRYDGIDLPDDSCRILIIDSKPYAQSLSDKFQEDCRSDSEIIDVKIAQKIEQGLGRGVRGEKDYCVILLNSPELINTVRNQKFKRFFSSQTKRQIEIGFEVTKFAGEDAETDNAMTVLFEVIKQCLARDEGWKSYYTERMSDMDDNLIDRNLLETLELEKKAEDAYILGDYQKGVIYFQEIIDKHIESDNKTERGWYLQEMARITHPFNKSEANNLQVAAHRNNKFLMKPRDGMVFQKLSINQSQLEKVKNWITQFNSFEELKARIDEILNNIAFGVKHDKFERALCEIGKLLGFESEQPDKEWKTGPDVLWNIRDNEYILFECKNEVKEERAEIHKEETGQMNNSCAWFKNNYGGSQVKNIIIIPTKTIAREAGFVEDVEVMRKSGLHKLTKSIRSFFNEFKDYNLKDITNTQINSSLKSNKLMIDDILVDYTDKPYQKK